MYQFESFPNGGFLSVIEFHMSFFPLRKNSLLLFFVVVVVLTYFCIFGQLPVWISQHDLNRLSYVAGGRLD